MGISLILGAHLSRIIEVLNNNLYEKILSLGDFNVILTETIQKSEAIGASLTFDFDIILKRISPISKKNHLLLLI